jgi:hypothetical protein
VGNYETLSTQFYALLLCLFLRHINKIENAVAISMETNKTNHRTEASGMYVPV